MDIFGIGAAINCALRMYERSARATGRTTRMIEMVSDGDLIICATEKEQRRLNDLLRDAGKEVRVFVCRPSSIYDLNGSIRSKGRTFFDHGFVEQYYQQAIDRATLDIDHFKQVLSASHTEQKVSAEMASRWID